jgi:hypothetical protein
MSNPPSDQQYVKMMNGPIQPSGLGMGYLLVGLMSVFLIFTNAYGFRRATNLPALMGLILAILLFAIKMYMLRRRPPHERASSSGLDRMLGYLAPMLLSIGLSAFAIFSYFVIGTDTAPRQPAGKRLENAVVALEDYYHAVRSSIRHRLELNAERLRQLHSEELSPQRQREIADLEEEQQRLRSLLRQVAVALRPDASDSAQLDNSSDGVNLSYAPIDEYAEETVEEKIRKKFSVAARLHQQLPDFIRRDVELPKPESLSEEAQPVDRLERFFRDTMALTNEAIGCLAVPTILELLIVIIVLSNRPTD